VDTSSTSEVPLNVRQNNPGNVDLTSIRWQGMAAVQSGRFITFVAPQWGFRCMARILRGHYLSGHTTVRSLIGDPIDGWAPANENDTGAYENDVSKRMGVGLDETLVFPDFFLPMLKAIAIHEGGCPWPDSVVQLGIDLERSA
jgi:hypothetical protein